MKNLGGVEPPIQKGDIVVKEFKYSSKKSRFNKNDVSVIGPELVRILGEYGESKPEVIVDEARKKGSPLHSYFTWDQKEAARLYNIREAQYMINNIQIEVIAPAGKVVRVNIASSIVRPQIGHVYQRTDIILANKSDREQLLESAWGELRSFIARYSNFVEFEPVIRTIRLQMKKHDV